MHGGFATWRVGRAVSECAEVEPGVGWGRIDGRPTTHGRQLRAAPAVEDTRARRARTAPDPDELLARVQAEEARQARGRLKIFLGYAAGVGKTYAMLEAAHQRRAEGVDVVVGYVETHGRAETEALVAGLEVIPRRQVEYRGTMLPEMDLDAVLARASTAGAGG